MATNARQQYDICQSSPPPPRSFRIFINFCFNYGIVGTIYYDNSELFRGMGLKHILFPNQNMGGTPPSRTPTSHAYEIDYDKDVVPEKKSSGIMPCRRNINNHCLQFYQYSIEM